MDGQERRTQAQDPFFFPLFLFPLNPTDQIPLILKDPLFHGILSFGAHNQIVLERI